MHCLLSQKPPTQLALSVVACTVSTKIINKLQMNGQIREHNNKSKQKKKSIFKLKNQTAKNNNNNNNLNPPKASKQNSSFVMHNDIIWTSLFLRYKR